MKDVSLMYGRCVDMTAFSRDYRTAATRRGDAMARDEARHGKAFEGLLKRYFGK